MIIALRADISMLLERTFYTTAAASGVGGSGGQLVDQDTLARLRTELRTKLDILKDNLVKELSENEVYLVMFPLVLLCDEMVMARLPKQQQTLWFLLQSELFQINYGGDVFYEFVDERLAKPDTPSMVFEVMYYCLSAGFVGKFGVDAGKVQRYKVLLCERIPGALTPLRKKRRRREPRPGLQPGGVPGDSSASVAEPASQRTGGASSLALEPGARSRSPVWYYLATLGMLLLAVGGVLALSNL
jgi:type VI secretion system protein ImpK